jgi:transcriptional regulator with XRE-family HTH domain
MVNLDNVVKRLLEVKGLSQGKEAAKILGISPADLSNRKKRGSLLPLLIEWAINEGVNLHWFITGEDAGKSREKPGEIEKSREFEILNQAEEWLSEIVKKNPKKEAWFEVEFEEKFQGFKEWKEEKLGADWRDEEFLPVINAAGGGGK